MVPAITGYQMHPTAMSNGKRFFDTFVAQLGRVPPNEGRGHRFETGRVRRFCFAPIAGETEMPREPQLPISVPIRIRPALSGVPETVDRAGPYALSASAGFASAVSVGVITVLLKFGARTNSSA